LPPESRTGCFLTEAVVDFLAAVVVDFLAAVVVDFLAAVVVDFLAAGFDVDRGLALGAVLVRAGRFAAFISITLAAHVVAVKTARQLRPESPMFRNAGHAVLPCALSWRRR
jgi:predicted PurR-regulated permease PerM